MEYKKQSLLYFSTILHKEMCYLERPDEMCLPKKLQ